MQVWQLIDPVAPLTLHTPSCAGLAVNRPWPRGVPHAPYTKLRIFVPATILSKCNSMFLRCLLSQHSETGNNKSFIRYCTSQYVLIATEINAACRPRLALGRLQLYTYYFFRKSSVLPLILQITCASQQQVFSRKCVLIKRPLRCVLEWCLESGRLTF